MLAERFEYLMSKEGADESLTLQEVLEGWHFCWEFDGLLRNSNEEDFKCNCNQYQNNSI